MKNLTLAFDIYGTIIDTDGVREELENILQHKHAARDWSDLWRDKQLEYSFRRAAMSLHTNFADVTSDALRFCEEHFERKLTGEEFQRLVTTYTRLPAFPDAAEIIPSLKSSGYSITAFSNGSRRAVEGLLRHTGLIEYFDRIVSTEEVPQFKPTPVVYRKFNEIHGSVPSETVLISGNSFDVIGALNTGWKSVWVKRAATAKFDTWGGTPDGVVNSLNELPDLLAQIQI